MVFAEELSHAERRVWDAFPTGRLVDFGSEDAEDDDPAGGEAWGPDRLVVRAEVLAALLSGAVEVGPGLTGQVFLARARVTGRLNLSGATLRHRLRLHECYIADGIDLSEASTRTLDLQGCHVGAVHLYRTKIDGAFVLHGVHLDGHDGPALTAGGLAVSDDMLCDEGFRADGPIDLAHANIGGQLSFRGARLDGKAGRSLDAQGLVVAADMLCDEGFHATGEVSLRDARIGKKLRLRGAHLDGKDGWAVQAEGLTVGSDMSCDLGFHADGMVLLAGARIGGQLGFRGAHLDGKGEPALMADELTITQSMFCDEGFQADGEVSLVTASVGGQLHFSGASLNGKGGRALNGELLIAAASMFCDEGFQADGEISLPGARVGRNLSFSGARIDGKAGPALAAAGLTIGGDMLCDRGFHATGGVILTGAKIGGQLRFRGAHLDGKGGPALIADELAVTLSMFCDEGFQADGDINLAAAKIGALIDDKNSWPKRLNIDRLAYGDLVYMPPRARLDWLNRSTNYSPQPYEQLAGYYRRLGHDEQARRVLLAKQRRHRRQRRWWMRWWGWLQDALAGYGYAPGRATLLLAVAFIAGWMVFRADRPVPVGPGPHPAFNAALYTLDVLIPAPALGQGSSFDPRGAALVVAAGLHILGWLLAITVVAAVTRSFSRTLAGHCGRKPQGLICAVQVAGKASASLARAQPLKRDPQPLQDPH